jgi:hypothetical protein
VGRISTLRPSRRPLRGLLRLRNFLNAIKNSLMLRALAERVSKHARHRCSLLLSPFCARLSSAGNRRFCGGDDDLAGRWHFLTRSAAGLTATPLPRRQRLSLPAISSCLSRANLPLVTDITRTLEDPGRGPFGIFVGAGIRAAVLSLIKAQRDMDPLADQHARMAWRGLGGLSSGDGRPRETFDWERRHNAQ